MAHGLEAGLREYDLTLAQKMTHPKTAERFRSLAAIEVKHQKRFRQAYQELTGAPLARAN